MHKKRILVLWVYLSLLALAACGPKVIDDNDIVSIDYKYSYNDGRILDEWTREFVIWDNSDFLWLESIIRWAKQDDVFSGKVNGKDIYWSEYDENLVQTYSNLVITEVIWISNPSVWEKVSVNSFWEGFIVGQWEDEEWYVTYKVDFNDPKTYSDLSYSVKINSVEKK